VDIPFIWERYHKREALNITIRDIAESAKVSKSTVSRVINNSGYVSEASRKKVEQAIEMLNFVPSAIARGLSKNVTNTIGVLIPEMWNDFFTEVLSGLSDAVDKLGMTLLFSDTANNEAKQEKALQMFHGQRMKGIIITPAIEFSSMHENRQFLKRLDKLNIPIVVVDRNIPNSRWDSIVFENFNAGYLATKAMIAAGRRRIGIITGDMRLAIARERFNGYAFAMEEAKLPVRF
jgi:LacI family transcriptional regulator